MTISELTTHTSPNKVHHSTEAQETVAEDETSTLNLENIEHSHTQKNIHRSATNILALQRIIGNQSVQRQLTNSAQGTFRSNLHPSSPTHSSIQRAPNPGVTAVTPDVGLKMLENISRGQPAFRPELGLGQCSWAVTEGNPYVGDLANKTVNLPVDVTLPSNRLTFNSARLESIFNNIASRTTIQTVEAEYRKTKRFPPNKPLTPAEQRALPRFKERLIERWMWEEVGKQVAASEAKVGEIIVQNSRFSKNGNGRFVAIADSSKIRIRGGTQTLIRSLEQAGVKAEPVIAQAATKLIRERNIGRVQTVFKYGGRIMIVVAVAGDIMKIYYAQNKVKAVVEIAGGWAGATAAAGAFAAYFTPADAGGPVAWALHGIGTLVAGGVGYWIGSESTRTIYELVLEE